MVDIGGEFAEARDALTDRDRASLIAAGVPPAELGDIGVTLVDLDRGGTVYQPLDIIGDRVFILPVRVGPDANTPESTAPELTVRAGCIIDLLAFHPSAPAHWATRRDAATWLGSIEPQYLGPAPVAIWRSPLTWLRGGRRGLCILTRRRHEVLSILLQCRGGVEAEDDAHARKLAQLAALPLAIPPISTRGGERRTA